MPSHQERIRAKNPEMNCEHIWIYHANSDIAPFILENGMRETVKFCLNCNLTITFVRSQEEFERELKYKFLIGDWSNLNEDTSKL
jgi:hypothetical protein